jgi:hypothetical protein
MKVFAFNLHAKFKDSASSSSSGITVLARP